MQIGSLWCVYNAPGAAGEAVIRMKHPELSVHASDRKRQCLLRVKHIRHSEENSNAVFTSQKMAPASLTHYFQTTGMSAVVLKPS